MEKGKGRPETGRSSTNILSRIRETAASKPEHQIRHLTEENRRLVYELGIAQGDLARLQGEQEQLVEAYDALEKRHVDDVQRLTKELEDSNLASAALEKERDSLKFDALGFQPPDELKDVANKATRSRSGTARAPSGADGSASQTQSTNAQALGGSSMQRLKDEVRQLHDADMDFQVLAKAFQHVDLERTRFKEATVGLEKELLVLRKELADTKNPALNLGKETVGSDVSFSKEDAVSISEVIEKASNLNEEIFQAAALLAGSLVLEQDKEMTPEETKKYTDYCTKMLGSKLTATLINEAKSERANEVNPFFVQVVLQIFLVKFCHCLVEFWKPNDSQYSEFLEHKIYKSIRDFEEQAVSGRWRSLTRKHIRFTTSDLDKKAILIPLSYIFKIANWVTANEESGRAFEQKLPSLLKAVEELRLAIGEQLISADIHLAAMETDQPFVRKHMEDAYEDGSSPLSGTKGRPPPKIVLGTVGFGLHQVSRDQRTVLDYNSVKPVRVALVSTVMEALALPPRTKGKANQ